MAECYGKILIEIVGSRAPNNRGYSLIKFYIPVVNFGSLFQATETGVTSASKKR